MVELLPRFKGIATFPGGRRERRRTVELLPRFKGIATCDPASEIVCVTVELLPRFKGIATPKHDTKGSSISS